MVNHVGECRLQNTRENRSHSRSNPHKSVPFPWETRAMCSHTHRKQFTIYVCFSCSRAALYYNC